MGKGAVADGWSGYRGEPTIEYGELRRERSQDGQLFLGEVVHDLLRVLHISSLVEIAFHKTIHVSRTIVADYHLQKSAGPQRGNDNT